ncbi:MAG: aminopeptidase P family protein [Rickettsiales bacterium]|jgi:Xaa-Pro aminopeptidase
MTNILQLRKLLAKNGIDAYLQPVHDEWMSEYPPACNRRVEWLAGFSGSAGLVVVTSDKAALFTDGRYTIQAVQQVSADYEVINSADTTAQEWLADNLPKNAKIGYDAKLYTKSMLDKFKSELLVPTPNLIDELWENRPAAPASKIFVHDVKYSGEESSSKRARVAEEIKKAGADILFLSAPESVNWLLNIRARDTENTPLCLAFATIDSQGKMQLFVDSLRCDAELKEHLGGAVKLCAPENLALELHSFSDKTMIFDVQTTTVFVTDLCEKAGIKLLAGTDPCVLFKAIKNPIELSGIRRAHIRDGVAVTKLLCWLDAQKNITELDVVDKILSFRKQNDLFVEPSFDAIAGSGEHGAIVHYHSTPESNRILQQGELFLLDSGGQYFDGTTDITRTVAIGAPNSEHKKRFTQVLKGHIALAQAIFPEGTVGLQIDVLARQYLWQDAVDYEHGTGHGVGCFLGVHEGPQGISKRGGGAPLSVGMVLSNEPGYYKAGEYGIRIENLMEVTEKAIGEKGKKFFGFDTLTCVPIDPRLVDISLLSSAEKEWMNNYHQWVKSELSSHLDKPEREWLEKQCQNSVYKEV